jgi:serine/threonine protein kinase/dipeptidyl aminopeptidase/acylaminoacyl peptidase
MGEVYKGRDTRLARTVAIKVLPALLHVDPVARERFEREARAISALNHPNICTLHDVGQQDGVDFLVMEYVEGETLASRLAKGPLPLDQALTYAIDLASAMDRAHRSGIVHRDIKPGNVMVTRTGVKLLDFGLAKASPTAPATGESAQLSDVTKSRLIAGTVQYMAPEQFEGRGIDARTDIFAFGAVLYEMVSGRKAFEGSSIGSLIAAIVERDPLPLSSVQPVAPPALDRIVATCLAKDPEDRWQTSRDLMRALQWAREQPSSVSPRRSTKGLWLASVIAATIVGAIARSLLPEEPGAPIEDVRFSIYPERGAVFATDATSVVAPQFALSPDGRHLVYVATSEGPRRLWVRTLNELAARPIDGTEDAWDPFWSPDSRSIAFNAKGAIKVVDLSGGLPVVRGAASRDTRGGAWAPDGTILISPSAGAGLSQLASDGSLRPVFSSTADGNPTLDRFPWMLADGRHFVFHHRDREKSLQGIYLATLGSDARARLTEGDYGPVVVDDFLLYLRGRRLMAQRLSVAESRLLGNPAVLLDNVAGATSGYMGASVSHTGSLAYAEPWPSSGELLWFSRDGSPLEPPVAPLGDYITLTLSPDGSRAAFSRVDPQTSTGDVWLADLVRGATTRLTSDPSHDAGEIWSPDGTQILFRSNRAGYNHLFVKGADDVRPEEVFFESPSQKTATHFSRDGSHVIFTGSGAGFDLWDLPTDSRRPRVIRETRFDEYQGVMSPDGLWLAYVSEETGVPQVYVQSFPNGEQRVQVSSQGGAEPKWREDGRELFFLAADRMMMAVRVSLRPTFTIEGTTPLFQTRVPMLANAYRSHYDVSADGERFLVNTTPTYVRPPAIHIVMDWRALLKKE